MIDVLKTTLTATQINKMKLALTAKLPIFNKPGKYTEVKFYEDKGDVIRMPRFYASSNVNQKNLDENLLECRLNPDLRFKGNLLDTKSRPQITAFHALEKHLKQHQGGMVVMAPGSGKTNLFIAVALHFGLKVMVIVHTDFLLSQWKKRIEDFVTSSGAPVKIGMIQQDVCETEGCDFVLASIQSLHSRDYDPESLRCGMMVVDEVHHIAAATFSKVLGKVKHYYSVGLTATLKRGDHLEYVIEYLVGSCCFQMKIPKNDKVQVNMITYSLGPQKEIVYDNGTTGLSSMVTILTKDTLRNKLIEDIINLLYLKFPTRKGLLLSERVDHLKQIYRKLDPSMCAVITGNIHTEMTKKERAQEKKKREELKFTKFLTLSTYKMFSEAVDFDGDFVILATPKVSIEQSTGRILRGRDLKHNPVIFDLVDPFSSFDIWRWTRFNFYKKRGYEIICLKELQIYNEIKQTNLNQQKTRDPKRTRDMMQ
jgi:superfamily II DNA or RNA helicase